MLQIVDVCDPAQVNASIDGSGGGGGGYKASASEVSSAVEDFTSGRTVERKGTGSR